MLVASVYVAYIIRTFHFGVEKGEGGGKLSFVSEADSEGQKESSRPCMFKVLTRTNPARGQLSKVYAHFTSGLQRLWFWMPTVPSVPNTYNLVIAFSWWRHTSGDFRWWEYCAAYERSFTLTSSSSRIHHSWLVRRHQRPPLWSSRPLHRPSTFLPDLSSRGGVQQQR